ncbi:MAG: YfcE family phosphodiesterase [Nitrososphaeraceae archaeon]
MKIGIISDTHDDIENVRRAIDIFSKEEVQYVIHAGDYVFPGIVMEFKNLNAKLIGVLGNNDGERGLLLKAFLEVGGELKGELGELHINDHHIGIYHGTSAEIKRQLIESGRHNIVVCGHTHRMEPADQGVGNYSIDTSTLVLNPGAGHRKTESLAGAFVEGGVIILNTQSREYRFIELP